MVNITNKIKTRWRKGCKPCDQLDSAQSAQPMRIVGTRLAAFAPAVQRGVGGLAWFPGMVVHGINASIGAALGQKTQARH